MIDEILRVGLLAVYYGTCDLWTYLTERLHWVAPLRHIYYGNVNTKTTLVYDNHTLLHRSQPLKTSYDHNVRKIKKLRD